MPGRFRPPSALQPTASRPSALVVPRERVGRYLFLPDRARNMGIHLMAGRGSGKSRLMGRVIGWQDFVRGVPLVVFDPMGATIDALLDKIARLSPSDQRALRVPSRLRYVDMAGGGRVVPFPLYYRLGDESLYEIARRFPDVVRKVDPQLERAPILGLNALVEIATKAGMVLAALGYQITEADDLLAHPELWEARLRRVVADYPEAAPAARFFLNDYPSWGAGERSRQTGAFSAKVELFGLDPRARAMFGASVPGIDWAEVIARRQAVLLDFRHEHGLERRRFKMMWAFSYLFEFIKHRGRARSGPVSVIVDELTELTNFEAMGVDLFAKELDALINVYARNCMVWLTLAHQEAFQCDERTIHTLMSLGTQVLGVTTDMDAALALAKQYFAIDPLRVKRHENVWGHDMWRGDYVIEQRPVEFTVEEQHYLSAEYFKRLGLFEFLVRPALREGDITGRVYPVSIKNLDRGQWVDEAVAAEARGALSTRAGVPVAAVLSEIAARLSTTTPRSLGILEGDGHADDTPVFGERATAAARARRR